MREPKRKKTSPVFAELAEDEESDWWRNFFDQLAEGIFPFHLSYINGSLSYIKNGKFNQLLVENQELEELRENVKEYIRKIVGIIPDDEMEEFSTFSSYTDINWKTILKDKLLRDILISKYISSLKLSKAEEKKLKSEIWWGFLRGDFTSANFEISDKEIVNYYPMINNKKETKNKNVKLTTITEIKPLKISKRPENSSLTCLQILNQLNRIIVKDFDD